MTCVTWTQSATFLRQRLVRVLLLAGVWFRSHARRRRGWRAALGVLVVAQGGLWLLSLVWAAVVRCLMVPNAAHHSALAEDFENF